MQSKNACGTEYRFSGTIWNAVLIPNMSFRSINWGQKSRPADVSTSCVTMAQLGAPSGQNQMKGSLLTFRDFIERIRSCSKMVSTVESTGQLGKSILSQPRKYRLCKCFRTATGINGRARYCTSGRPLSAVSSLYYSPILLKYRP